MVVALCSVTYILDATARAATRVVEEFDKLKRKLLGE